MIGFKLKKIFKYILNYFRLIYKYVNGTGIILKPEKSYNLLSDSYDNQKFNILHNFDQATLKHYIDKIDGSIQNSLDFGAGTGRNIPFLKKITKQNIYAYDISIGMLSILKNKFSFVITNKYSKNKSLNISNSTIDLILCNITLGYIENLKTVFSEWDRVLTPSGRIIITDLHPSMNPYGLNRNFDLNGKNLIIKSKSYSKSELHSIFKEFHWSIIDYREHIIDDSHKSYFDSEHSYIALLGEKLFFSFFLQKSAIL